MRKRGQTVAKPYGRELEAGWEVCGGGEVCGSVKSTWEERVEYKECSPDDGTCKQNHGTCGCHLFKADSRNARDPWHFAADPGKKVRKEDHMDYRCICSKRT
jgi:hypothetical protein